MAWARLFTAISVFASEVVLKFRIAKEMDRNIAAIVRNRLGFRYGFELVKKQSDLKNFN